MEPPTSEDAFGKNLGKFLTEIRAARLEGFAVLSLEKTAAFIRCVWTTPGLAESGLFGISQKRSVSRPFSPAAQLVLPAGAVRLL